MIKALEQAISKVRALSEDRQRLAAELLEELASIDATHVLSEDELAILLPALERTDRGEFAAADDVAALWRKSGL